MTIRLRDELGYDKKNAGEWAQTIGRMANAKNYPLNHLKRIEGSVYQVMKHAIKAGEHGVRRPIKIDASIDDDNVSMEVAYPESRQFDYSKLVKFFDAAQHVNPGTYLERFIELSNDEVAELFSVYKIMDEFSISHRDARTNEVKIAMKYSRKNWELFSADEGKLGEHGL